MCKIPTTDSSRRNLLGFWLLGLCNNFSYVIMLSAANDILYEEKGNSSHDSGNSSHMLPNSNHTNNDNSTYLKCNRIGTAAILLADILPALIVKLLAPVYINLFGYGIKVFIVMTFATASFLIVGLVESITINIIGVVCASISSGFGEPVFLGLTAHFHRDVISAWSSGTGGAGIFGSLAYAGLTQAGLKPRTAVLMMLFVTGCMGVSYFFVLKRPMSRQHLQPCDPDDESSESLIVADDETKVKRVMTAREKIRFIPSLFKYMAPLTAVYFAEYFINQGLMELLYFKNIWLKSKDMQYRWYQVDYQLGVFISRSSVKFFHFKRIWIMPILQFLNLALLMSQVFLRFLPSFWIIMAVILFEGLIGGAAYVNTFYKLYNDVEEHKKEYAMSVVSVADSLGICVSGAVNIPVHNAICSYKIKI